MKHMIRAGEWECMSVCVQEYVCECGIMLMLMAVVWFAAMAFTVPMIGDDRR